MKVHVINADITLGAGIDVWLAKNHALGAAIAKLAAQSNETVYFHAPDEVLLGAPNIFLECSDAFLNIVQQLPEYKSHHDMWQHIQTQRSQDLWAYFSTTPIKGFPKPNFIPL
ncbi:MAG: hypothetical protein GC136_11120 [Alphaproteobacteria bacterium]|nr:hypothetical protein [Alphaproteobacteria bacterium]